MRGLNAWLTTDPAVDCVETCDVQSPDGRYKCGAALDHEGDHVALRPVELWRKLTADDFISDRASLHWKIGDVISSENTGTDAVVIARWPQRDDDFDEFGEPTHRGGTIEG